MRNKRIINYALLKYYYDSVADDEQINFDAKQDRMKLVLEFFKNLKLYSRNIEQVLLEGWVKKFYEKTDLNLISFSKELNDLLGFCILQLSSLIVSSEPRDGNLISFNDVLVDVQDKFYQICDNETREEYSDAINILRDIFGENFPLFDEELINMSFNDEKSPYYNKSKK